jgi:ABC-type uncharacterized transport system auxiliary subunit
MTGCLARRSGLRSQRRARTGLPVSLALALLVACALPPAPVDHHYQIKASASQVQFERQILGGTLRIKRPRASPFIDGTRIVYRRSDEPAEVIRSAYQHWVDAPTLMLRDELIRVMRDSGAAEQVITSDLRIHADYTLAGRLLAFELVRSDSGSEARVELELSLIRSQGQVLLLHGVYAESEGAESNEPSAQVEALSRALDRVLTRFLHDLAATRDDEPQEISAWHP